MRTTLKFWTIMLLLFNAAAYGVWWSDLFQYNNTPQFALLQPLTTLPFQTLLLTVVNVFLVVLVIFFYVLERFRDREEDRRITDNKRESRRRYYRRRAERRKRGEKVPVES